MERQRLCSFDHLESGEVERFDVDGHRIALVRLGDEYRAVGDRCSHANYSLSEGEVDVAARSLECPKHGSCFSVDTGEPDTLPATRPVPVYPIAVEGDDIVVTLAPVEATP